MHILFQMCGYKNYQCARIGVGMISRGEVALIVASKGEALGMLGGNFLGPVIIVVVITTIITPILLKIVFKSGPNVSTDIAGPMAEAQRRSECKYPGKRKRSDFLLRGY